MTASPLLLVAVGDGHEAVRPWLEAFRSRLPGFRVAAVGEDAAAAPRYVAAWKHPPGALAPFTSAAAIFSLGAGVDHLMADWRLPAGVPIVRVVDPDLTARMSEWVVLHVLTRHRQARRYERQQAECRWDDDPHQPAARDVRVGILGLGTLGRDAAGKLAGLGFAVAGWSRTPQVVPGIATFHGADGLDPFLGRCQILVALLPLTPQTRGILSADLFRKLARDGHLGGPVLINAGRGGLQNEADIIRCLDDGTLASATLDVFVREPLPVDSALWRHPAVTVTPHNAAISNPAAIADFVAAQIDAHERGEPLRHVVERGRGY